MVGGRAIADDPYVLWRLGAAFVAGSWKLGAMKIDGKLKDFIQIQTQNTVVHITVYSYMMLYVYLYTYIYIHIDIHINHIIYIYI